MDPAPELAGIHHVTLSVSDLDATLAWYRDVLGFDPVMSAEVDGLRKALLTRDGIRVSFVEHGDLSEPGPFSERRVGLDHLSFAVAGRSELDRWAEILDGHGVRRSPIVAGTMGDVLSFRDPDNIALEFYAA